MSAINIFRKSGEKFKFALQLFSKLIHQSRNHLIAVYSVIGEKTARNEIFLNCFCNYLLRNDEPFSGDLSSHWTDCDGSDEKTAGIWMWSSPFTKVLTDGTLISIILLNAQFCTKGNSQMQDNALVLTMTTLLSSVMIMNQNDIFNEDLLHFIRHSTVFARYELNDDQPFQKLILFFQDWDNIKQDCADFADGIHNATNPDDFVDLNFRYEYLIPNEKQSIKERSVRQSLLSTFDEVIVCLSEHRLEYNERHIDEKEDCYSVGLHYPWKVVRSLCESDFIAVKTIVGDGERHPITGEHLLYQLNKWCRDPALKEHHIPSNLSAEFMDNDFMNKMALNSAIDYYYYEIEDWISYNNKHSPGSDYYTSNKDVKFEDFQSKVVEESVELFQSFQLFGPFELETIRSFWEKLNDNQNYLNELKIDKLCPIQKTSLEDILKRLESVEELKDKYKEIKSETDDMKKDFDNKFKLVMAEMAKMRQGFNKFENYMEQKSNQECFDALGFVADGITYVTMGLLKLAKVVYKNTVKY